MMQPLPPADCCLWQLLPFVWQFPQNALPYGNGIDQTSKLEGVKHEAHEIKFEAQSTLSCQFETSKWTVTKAKAWQ